MTKANAYMVNLHIYKKTESYTYNILTVKDQILQATHHSYI